MRTEQSFTGLGPEDWCSSWGLNKVLLVLDQRTGAHREDWTKYYWSWTRGLVLIMRTEQSFTGLGPEDWCSSWGLNKVLLVLDQRTAKTSKTLFSPHDEHQSSGPRPVKLCSVLWPKTSKTLFSPHDEHHSSGPRPVKLCSVLTMSTSTPAQDP
jgi:hypothetical protein